MAKQQKEKKIKVKHPIRRTVILMLCLVLVVAIALVAVRMFVSNLGNIEDLGYETIYLELPDDGSKPTDHTGVENIGYMNCKLHSQPYYYSEMHGEVDTIMHQDIITYKQFYNGVLISSDITTSSMINSAVQFCTTDTNVIWREAAGGKSTYNGLDTVYSSGTPKGNLSISDYKVARGFPPSEFSVYVINEDTVLDCSAVTDNGDGTYTQTFYLNGCTEPGENSAIYYYKQQMVATGGLTEYPVFTSCQITYTFDAQWQVLRAEVEEAYRATMGVSVNCTSDSYTDYYYDEDLAYNTVYDDYFAQYEDVVIVPEEDEITAVSCLSNAFGSVLTEPVVFSLDMDIDGQSMSGLLYLDIGSMDIRADLGNIQLYMEQPKDDELDLYLGYGSGVKVKMDVDSLDLSALTSGNGDDADGSDSADGASGSGSSGLSLDTDALFEELGDGEFWISDDGSHAYLNSVLDLFGLTLPVDFVFDIDADSNITLGNVTAQITMLGTEIDLELAFSDKTVAALTAAEKAEYEDIGDNVNGIVSLVSLLTSNDIDFEITYETDEMSVAASVELDLANSMAKGEIAVDFGGDSSVKYIGIEYAGGNLYITLDSADMDPLKVKANVDEAIDLISGFLGTDILATDTASLVLADADNGYVDNSDLSSGTTSGSSSLDISGILSDLNIDLGDLVYRLLADEDFAAMFSMTETGDFEVDGTALLGVFGLDLEIGMIDLHGDGNVISIADGPFTLAVTTGDPFTVDEEYYVEAEDLIQLIEEIETLIETQRIGLSGPIDVSVNGTDIVVNIDSLVIDWSNGISLFLHAEFDLSGTAQHIYASYDSYTDMLQLAYGQVGMELCLESDGADAGAGSTSADMTDLQKLETALVAAYNQIAELVNSLSSLELDTNASSLQDILDGLGVAADTTASLEDLISELLGIDSGSGSGTDGAEGEDGSGTAFDIMSILADLSFGLGTHGGFEVKYGPLDVEITDISKDHELNIDLNLRYTGDSFGIELEDWSVTAGDIYEMPDGITYITADDLAAMLDVLGSTAELFTGTVEIEISYTSDSVDVTGEIFFNLQDKEASGEIAVTLKTAAEDENGNSTGSAGGSTGSAGGSAGYVQAGTVKYIAFSYLNSTFYLSLYSGDNEPLLVKAGIGDVEELISKYITISAEGDGTDDGTTGDAFSSLSDIIDLSSLASFVDGMDAGSIISAIFTDGEFFEIFSLDTSSGAVISMDIAELCSVLGLNADLGEADLSTGNGHITLDLDAYGVSMDIHRGADIETDETYYAEAEDIVKLIDELIAVVEGKSIGLSGTVTVTVYGTAADGSAGSADGTASSAGGTDASTEVVVYIDNMVISWEDGISLYAHMHFFLSGEQQDIWVSYDTVSNTMMLAYGQVGLALNFDSGSGSDLDKLETALASAYNQIAAAINQLSGTNLGTDADSLQGILIAIGVVSDTTESLEDLITDLIESLGSGNTGTGTGSGNNGTGTGSGNTGLDLMSILADLGYGKGPNGGLEVTLGSLGLDLEITDITKEDGLEIGVNLIYTGDSFSAALENWILTAGDRYTVEMPDITYVTADDIVILLDALGSTAELLTETMQIDVAYTSDYADVSGVILINLADSQASGDITVTLKTSEEDENGNSTGSFVQAGTVKEVTFSYTEKTFYLGLSSSDMEPFYVKASVDDAIDLIQKFLATDDDGDTGNNGDSGENAEAGSNGEAGDAGDNGNTSDTTGNSGSGSGSLSDITDLIDLGSLSSFVDNMNAGSIITKVFMDGQFFDVFSITDRDSEAGSGALTIDIQALCSLLGLDVNLGNADVSLGNGHVTLGLEKYGATLDIHKSETAISIDTQTYVDAEDLIELIDGIMDIVDAQSVSLSGMLSLNISGTEVYLDILESSINWESGVSVYMHAYLGIDSVEQEIWLSYDASTQTFMFAYGPVGATLCFEKNSEDVTTLKAALVDAYNRIVTVISSLTKDGDIQTAESLEDILDIIGAGADLSDLIDSLFGSTGSGSNSTGSGENGTDGSGTNTAVITTADIIAMIANASFGAGQSGSQSNSLAVSLDELSIGGVSLSDLSLEIAGVTTDEDNQYVVSLNIGGSLYCIDVALSNLTATVGDIYEMPSEDEVSYLGADEFALMIDYLASTAELISEHSITIGLTGTQYDYSEAYDEYENVKYNISGTFAIEWDTVAGENDADAAGNTGVGTEADAGTDAGNDADTEDVTDTTANPFYMYAAIAMEAPNPDDDSYVISLYIMDRNYDGSTDGLLDLYLSISNKATDAEDSEPLMNYVPASEIMTLVAMGGALCDLGSLTISNETLQSILTAVADFVDTFIETYIPDTQSQFASLGSMIFSMVTDGGLQGLLNSLIDSISSSDETGDTTDDAAAGTATDTAVVADTETDSDAGYTEGTEGNEESTERQLVDAYISSITISSTEFELVVNSDAVYGGEADGDLVVTVTRDDEKNLTSASISNVYYNGVSDMLEIGMTFDKSVTRVTDITDVEDEGYVDFSEYLDWAELDSMIEMLVNSVTSKTDEASTDYALNNNFFFSGNIEAKISLLDVDLDISIDALSVNIDDDFNFSLDAQITYEKYTFIYVIPVIDTSATVNISIRNDMIYMRKAIVDGDTTYRIMTMSEFGSDILNQIEWLLSFGSGLDDIIELFSSSAGGGSSVDVSGYDYGKIISTYLAEYSHTEDNTNANWKFEINGDTISTLSGITLSDLTATFIGSKNADADAYIWDSLVVTGSMYDVIEAVITLNYDNPQGTGDMSSDVVSIYDVSIQDSFTWDDVLGGTTFDDICEHIDWDALIADTGTTYFEYTDGDDLTSITVNYEFYDYSDGSTTILASYENVLYNTSTGTIYTLGVERPDISDRNIYNGDTLTQEARWTDPSYSISSKTLTVTGRLYFTYFDDITVNYYWDTDTQYTSTAYEATTDDYTLEIPDITSYGYQVVGWAYYDNSVWKSISDAEDLAELGLTTVDLYAVLVKLPAVTLEASGSYKLLQGTTYTATFETTNISAAGEVSGGSFVIESAVVSYYYGSQNDTSNSLTSTASNDEITYDTISETASGTKKSYVTTVYELMYTYTVDGGVYSGTISIMTSVKL